MNSHKVNWGSGYRFFKCPDCGHRESLSSHSCPKCGTETEMYGYERHYEWPTDKSGNLLKMTRREFVMLLQTYDGRMVEGDYYSEKKDGICVLWDGGISKGLLCSEVPFANTDKHGRYKKPLKATGLWTRYGQPIQAPPRFTHTLPPFPLHGELYIPGLTAQDVNSVVKRLEPDPIDWMPVRFYIFDIPGCDNLFQMGTINNPNFKKMISEKVTDWAKERMGVWTAENPFHESYKTLKSLSLPTHCEIATQYVLQSHEHLIYELNCVVERGGEGLVVRKRDSVWLPQRTWNVMKVKPELMGEGRVIGLHYGQGKLLGLMGSLIVEWLNPKGKKVVFSLSGFTDEERLLLDSHAATLNPGQRADDSNDAVTFPKGTTIRFKYRELTNDGQPKEARKL